MAAAAAAANAAERAAQALMQHMKPSLRVGTHLMKRRTGAIGVKLGMTALWDKWGTRIPLTVIELRENQVVEVKTRERNGYNALQIGADDVSHIKHVKKPQAGHFAKWGVVAKRTTKEFLVHEDALLPPGTCITTKHFMAGQFVDIKGISRGKGFAGAMKRWGFAGGPASHGCSLAHRALGSTGNRKQPGRVFPGKKMPGRMGGKGKTIQSLWLYKIDHERNLLLVKGAVPGPEGGYVYVKDALRKANFQLPFPTWDPNDPTDRGREEIAPAGDNPHDEID